MKHLIKETIFCPHCGLTKKENFYPTNDERARDYRTAVTCQDCLNKMKKMKHVKRR